MYIMKLKPVLKDYIWGGTRLKDDFKMETSLDKVAEAWTLSCHKDGKSIIENGEYSSQSLDDVIESIGAVKLVGTQSEKFPYFPVLIKLIDAKDNLSVQVHPDNDYAQRVEGEFGKTEIWYVVDAAEDAKIIYGFKNEITSEEFRSAIENNTLLDTLNTVSAKKGDLFFIEAGTVHAIGKGVFVAEIQQNSNSTYRVYDYGRVGADGKPRELHIDKAVDVSITKPPVHPVAPQGKRERFDGFSKTLLTKCDLFTVNKYEIENALNLKTNEKSFNHILIIDGEGTVDSMPFKKGDSFFVPANYGEYKIRGNAEVIITNI